MTILEFVGIQAKMYSLKTLGPDGKIGCSMKGKGIPSRELKRLQCHNDYVNVLNQPQVNTEVQFKAIRSKRHQVEHRHITKRGLTGDNDKVFVLGPNASRPLGHWRNSLAENEKDESQKAFEAECASKWPSLDQDLKEFRAMKDREAAEKKKKNRKRKVEEDPDGSAMED